MRSPRLSNWAVALALVILTGCAATDAPQPQVSTSGIRPGVTASFDLASAAPRVGAVYAYRMTSNYVPFEALVETRVGRRGADYTHTGTMTLLPTTGSPDQLEAELRRRANGADIRRQGDQIVTEVFAVTDNAYRAKYQKSTFVEETNSPNDCFAVIGVCRYRNDVVGEGNTNYIVQTTEEGGIWRANVWVDTDGGAVPTRQPLRQEVFSLDRDGMLLHSRTVRFERGRQLRTDIVRVPG